ncbi:hypothetical protein, partial [Arthrobacter sp. Cr_A7]|uniref:hypothetical protein n=1 Tax=Arthrobacter sp. Cr_A7 TaxID=3031017 RepID=UPI0023DA5787
GPGTAELCGAGTGPNSRPRQRTPINWLKRSANQREPSEPASPPSHGQPNDTTAQGLPPAAASRAPVTA